MSVTAPATPASPDAPATRRRRSRRWLRIAIPFAVLAAIWLGIGIAHAIQTPDLGDEGTLSPTGTGDEGSSRLAELLRQRGVTIDRVTSSDAVAEATRAANATVFVPTPGYLNPAFFTAVTKMAGVRRVVVVEPGLVTTAFGRMPIAMTADAWATRTVDPACDSTPPLPGLGRAAVFNSAYIFSPGDDLVDDTTSCYGGGLVWLRQDFTETFYLGSSDPFRNDRIDESANATLAMALLDATTRVVWVDVHSKEPVARPEITLPPLKLPDYRRPDSDHSNTGFPLFDAFPSWFWGGLLLLFVAVVMLAVARARRLGPPVAEPLPVLVPASESVTGRGRLYHRIRARESTVEALRAAAIARMAAALNPFGGASLDTTRGSAGANLLVWQIAQHTGAPEPSVRQTLYGPPPDDDAALTSCVARLDELVAAVLSSGAAVHRNPAPQPRPGQPAPSDPTAGGTP